MHDTPTHHPNLKGHPTLSDNIFSFINKQNVLYYYFLVPKDTLGWVELLVPCRYLILYFVAGHRIFVCRVSFLEIQDISPRISSTDSKLGATTLEWSRSTMASLVLIQAEVVLKQTFCIFSGLNLIIFEMSHNLYMYCMCSVCKDLNLKLRNCGADRKCIFVLLCVKFW